MSRQYGLPLIRLSAVNPVLQELERRGLDASALLRQLELPDAVPASPNVFVAAKAAYRLIERAAEAAADPFLGFHVGSELDLSSWIPISIASQKAQSVGELLSHFIVCAHDHSSATRYFLNTEAENSTFGLKRAVVPELLPAQNDAFYVAWFARLLAGAAGEYWDPNRVVFRVADPSVIPWLPQRLRIAEGDRLGFRGVFPTEWLFTPFDPSSLDKQVLMTSAPIVAASIIESVHQAPEPHLRECAPDGREGRRDLRLQQTPAFTRAPREGNDHR